MAESALRAGSARDIIEHMRRVAAPGQQRLDENSLRQLTDLTRDLLAATRETQDAKGAEDEHARFLSIQHRELSLPEDDLAGRLKDATVLVTGGTGCVGSTLMAQLAARATGRVVSVSRGVTACWQRVDHAEYLTADIRDRAALAAVVGQARPDVIFHVAAQRDPGLAEVEVHRTITTNVLGTRNVIEAAKLAGVPQVVYASTGKALRPYSGEVYTASKRAAEWLMAGAASSDGLTASAARFTHVIDNSIIYRRLLDLSGPAPGAIPAAREPGPSTGEPIRLHDPDICFYVQSALESAQLLLAACLGTAVPTPGDDPRTPAERELRVHAISDLGLPMTLLDLALGVLASTKSTTPVYFSGYDAGYEKAPFPGLYDPLTAGDVSPLLNAFEAACITRSPTGMTDASRLEFAPDPRLAKQLAALEEDCDRTACPAQLRGRLSDLSWALLDSTLRAAPRRALERCAARARRHWDAMIPDHRRMLEAIDDLITR
jgi:hypothetical protein